MECMLRLIHYVWKPGLLIALVLIAISLSRSMANADHEKFEYKFPCLPADACYVTTLAHVGNAFDFDPQGSAGLGTIPAVSEGIFRGYITASSVCTTSGLGKYAVVDDQFGRTLRYAHLSSFGTLQTNSRVHQGDKIGIEGNTGNTTNCAPHLHLEGISTTSYIDGLATSSITAGPTLYNSTNSRVGYLGSFPGEATIPSLAIRAKYVIDGVTYGGGSSWGFFGWTADLVSPSPPPVPQVGCAPSNPYCQLYVHYEPDPQVGYWGSIIDFKKHPEDVLIGGTTVPFNADAIMSGRWNIYSAFTVRLPFYLAWLLGDTETVISVQTGDIGLPLLDQIPGGTQLCPASAGCIKYQRFSHGYIWESSSTGIQSPIFCPDVASPLPGGWPDYFVSMIGDITGVIEHFAPDGYGGQPYEPSEFAQFDINGDGAIVLIGDITAVINAFAMTCHP